MAVRRADVLVVGVGTMGSLACWRIARRGASVIGLEQFEPGHDRGSGHGGSRVIRTAYYEGPEYVPLVQASFGLWRELERDSGAELLKMTGALMIGRPDCELVGGAMRSAQEHSLDCELLGPREVQERFPQHRLRPDEVALWETEAGVLRPELAIRAAAGCAEALGARVVSGARVRALAASDGAVRLEAGEETFEGRHLVVCAGPWLGSLLPELELPLAVERQVMVWFAAHDAAAAAPERFPVFMREHEGRCSYGLPDVDGNGVKVAIHHGGRCADPDQPEREVASSDLAPVCGIVAEELPGLDPRPLRATTCLYTNTPDRHFLVGASPGGPRVTLLGGFSGHGFKFAPVMGEIAADLALEGSTAFPVGRFSPARFA